MSRLLALVAVIALLTGCAGGVSGPCVNEAQDPTGICAGSHSHVGG
jgi:hypothetical protein